MRELGFSLTAACAQAQKSVDWWCRLRVGREALLEMKCRPQSPVGFVSHLSVLVGAFTALPLGVGRKTGAFFLHFFSWALRMGPSTKGIGFVPSVPLMSRHCHHCGWAFPRKDSPGRSETCPQCRADLRVCLNCRHFDASAAHQCRESRAEPVYDKQLGTFCEYFEFAQRAPQPPAAANTTREETARDSLKRLLGD